MAEAQLFLTLLLSIVLRTSEESLSQDALSEDDYGGILVVAFFAAPSVEAIICARKVVQFCMGKRRKQHSNNVSGGDSPGATHGSTAGHPASIPEGGLHAWRLRMTPKPHVMRRVLAHPPLDSNIAQSESIHVGHNRVDQRAVM